MLVTKPRSHERTTEVKQGHPQSAIQMETSPGRKRGLCPTRKAGRSAEGSRHSGTAERSGGSRDSVLCVTLLGEPGQASRELETPAGQPVWPLEEYRTETRGAGSHVTT